MKATFRPFFQSFALFLTIIVVVCVNAVADDLRWSYGETGQQLQLLEAGEHHWTIQGPRLAPSEIADLEPELLSFFNDYSDGQSIYINGREVINQTQLIDELIGQISSVPLNNASYWFAKFRMERDRIMENTIALRPLNGVLTQQSILIVTHASAIFDINQVIAPMVDYLGQKFKSEKKPILYIMNRDELFDLTWFPKMRNPDYVIDSTNGHFDAQLDVSEVVMTGGFFSLCFNRSLNVVLQKNKKQNFTVRIPLLGVYEDKYFFPQKNPTPAYSKWFEQTRSPVDLAEILKFAGVKSFKSAVESLFERTGNYHLTIKLQNKTLKKYYAKKRGARNIQLIFE